MTDEMQKLRKTIGQLFESLPELTEATLTIGGKRYRARLSMPWVCMDTKAEGRGWDCWTEYALPEFYRRRAMGPDWMTKLAEERTRNGQRIHGEEPKPTE